MTEGGGYAECSTRAAWPGFIFTVIIIVVLIGIAFSGKDVPMNQKIWTFVTVLIIGIVWIFVIYWFCMVGYTAIGWFLLLLPFLYSIGWWLSMILARWTTSNDCVFGLGTYELMWL